jgi:hypothetical protein
MGEAEGLMKGPEGVLLRFHYDAVKNEVASTYAGRPIYDNVLLVEMLTPGAVTGAPKFEIERIWAKESREAIPSLTKDSRLSSKYQELREFVDRFKANEDVGELQGTPLKEWPRIDRATAASLSAVNIFTVEAVAALSDQHLSSLGMGGTSLREAARAFISDDNAGTLSRLVDENNDLKMDNQRMAETLKLLSDQLQGANQRLSALEATQVAPNPLSASTVPLSPNLDPLAPAAPPPLGEVVVAVPTIPAKKKSVPLV